LNPTRQTKMWRHQSQPQNWKINPDPSEDWAQSQFDKALQLINELNESSKSDRRESYKMQILSQGKYQNAEISNLIDQIKSILKRSRITFRWFICIQNNQTDKVLETARKLNSNTHFWMGAGKSIKDYLENNEGEKP
jgi:3'-phosphoadenosine 5'-phosphosulfate sulfotransferase